MKIENKLNQVPYDKLEEDQWYFATCLYHGYSKYLIHVTSKLSHRTSNYLVANYYIIQSVSLHTEKLGFGRGGHFYEVDYVFHELEEEDVAMLALAHLNNNDG